MPDTHLRVIKKPIHQCGRWAGMEWDWRWELWKLYFNVFGIDRMMG